MIYLDNAATTKVIPEACEAAAYAMQSVWGNPSSLHRMGIEAERLVTYAKKQLLSALGDTSGDIIFTSGATEGNNTAVFGFCKVYGKRKKRVVTTSVEHPSVAQPFQRLKDLGYEVVTVSPDKNGEITADSLISAVDDNTCLISAMLCNNETGYILPISEAFAEIKRQHPDCMTHCDCVQGFEKLTVSAKKLSADVITLSGHKIYAPKGIGAMYVKKGVRLSPVFFGGGQQKNLRSGTEAVPLIYSFGKAVEILTPTLKQRFDNAAKICEYAKAKLNEIGAVVISKDSASPYILSIAVPNIKSETILHFLEEDEIYISSGSACSKGKKSAVLKEFKVSDQLLDSVIRLSFSFETQTSDIDALVDKLGIGIKTLAKIKR